MVAEVFAGLGALKSAFDIARGIKDLDDAAKRNAAVINLQQTILTAQQAQAALLEEMDRLKKENAVKEWEVGKDDYQLIQLGNETFVFTVNCRTAVIQPIISARTASQTAKIDLAKERNACRSMDCLCINRCGLEIFDGGGRSSNASKR